MNCLPLPDPLPLGEREAVRLWWVRPEAFHETPEVLSLLSLEERAQQLRFIPPGKRHEFLVARVLARRVLGEALRIDPASVRFTNNEWGRPELSPACGLRFNITHTDGLVALLISDQHEVGVDTELFSRAPRILALGPNVFAPKELTDLSALPSEQQAHRAVTLWTLKESYIKARGMGLALALDGFSFRFEESRIRLEVEPALNDDGELWQFQTITHGPHLISTAIRNPSTMPAKLELIEATI